MEVHGSRYVRFAALGDSSTFGLGDPVVGGWRGWARLLADAMVTSGHDVSFCNVAIPGATSGTVLRDQLADALAHSPDVAALVVGVNDVLRSTWDPARLREDVFACADALSATGATLLTVRFHDHSQVLPLPQRVQRGLRQRVDALNAAWDDVHAAYGGPRVDLSAEPALLQRRFWAIDRMHPSEQGHRHLARAFAGELTRHGLAVDPPSATCSGGLRPSWRRDTQWLLVEAAPWLGRRARDLGPWAARRAWQELRPPVRAT